MRKNNELFFEYINELISHPVVQNMENVAQHVEGVNCLDHSIFVSFISFKLATYFGGDVYAATRAGLLHDCFQCHWRETDVNLFQHLMSHAQKAVEMASIFNLSETEVHAIQTHMWPVTITKMPKSKEAAYVNMADKISSIIEVTGIYKLLVVHLKYKSVNKMLKLTTV